MKRVFAWLEDAVKALLGAVAGAAAVFFGSNVLLRAAAGARGHADARNAGGTALVPDGRLAPGAIPADAATAVVAEPRHAPEPRNYLNEDYRLRSWLTTTDHKRIAILYMISITLFFVLGGIAATLIRLNLLTPRGLLMQKETYNRMFTLHGVIMVWFFLIPAVPAVLGNFVLPLQIGARDLAFPKLNLASWYLFNIGGLFTLIAMVAGGLDTGWTFYTPLSTHYSNAHVTLTAAGVFITGFSTIFTGINFIVTTHKLRCPGLGWFRLPLFIWTIYATSVMMVLATPVLAMSLVLIALERVLHIGIFDPTLGGDPLLFQHLFWFYSHPAVYIMILPGMGIVTELITCFSRKPLFSYKFVCYATFGIAIFSFLVWGHHMFVAGTSMYASMLFSVLSFLVAIPSAIKVFNWTATFYKGSISFDTPMLYAIGFIGLFTIGGLTGLFLAALGVDVPLHDTYFVIAHFHYIMVGGMVMAYLGGIHYWWPKMTGRLYPELWGKLSALSIFVGFNLTFFPQFILGRMGMPRRYPAYPPDFQVLNVASTLGASILAFGYAFPLVYLTWSLWYGKRAPANPWGANTLEWQTSSPPPRDNFVGTPVVTTGPYEYDPVAEERLEAERRRAQLAVTGGLASDTAETQMRQAGPDDAASEPVGAAAGEEAKRV